MDGSMWLSLVLTKFTVVVVLSGIFSLVASCSCYNHPKKMAFVGVQFAEKDKEGLPWISTIREEWLTPKKKEAFWPPYKHQHRFQNALMKGEVPVEGKWDLYKITKILFESDDIHTANKKIIQYELTSDVQTDYDDELLKNDETHIIKRKACKPSRFDDYLSSDDDETSFHVNKKHLGNTGNIHPRPPKIPPISSDVAPSSFISPKTSIYNTTTPTITSQTRRELFTKSQTRKESSTHNTSVLEEQVLTLLYQIKEQNNEILNFQRKYSKTNTLSRALPDDIPVQLPLNTKEDIDIFEDYLENQENFQNLVLYLSSLGGRDVVSQVNNILKHMLTNLLAKDFSFWGKRMGKQPFGKLKLKIAVVNAVKSKTSSEVTEKQIEDSIKVWLKHAPQRLKKVLNNTESQI